MCYFYLFKFMQLNQLMLCNWIVSIVYVEVYVELGGLLGDCYICYYEEKVKGGVGLVICGGLSLVLIDSLQGWWKLVNLLIDKIIDLFMCLVDMMYKYGVKIMIQVMYMGCCLLFYGEYWLYLMLLLGVCEFVYCGNVKIIEIEEICCIIGDFVVVVKCVKVVGMDGIEIFVVYQYLIDQFWSKCLNYCIDEWGGSFENCLCFGIEVLMVVCEVVGKDFCVGLCMCGDEFYEDGFDYEVLKEIVQVMLEMGLIDYLSVVGLGGDMYNMIVNCMLLMVLLLELFVYLVVGIKLVVKILVMYVQSICDVGQVECLFVNGMIDLVGMMCVQIVDLYMVIKICDGCEDEIK